MVRMQVNVIEINESELKTQHLDQLLERNLDCLIVKNAVDSNLTNSQVEKIEKGALNQSKIQLPDGYFFPLPYSAVHNDAEGNEATLQNKYFKSAESFKQQVENILSPDFLEKLYQLMRKIGLEKNAVLSNAEGKQFSTLNFRMLQTDSNGILIHCENSFLGELGPSFREELYQSIDIENALSFLIIVQAPEEGGELILFDADWENTPIPLNNCSPEERHVKNKVFFSNHGHPQPKESFIKPENGDLIIFRAAQLWHSVNSIKGKKDRCTLGFFIAEDKEGNLKYWA